MHAAVKAPGDYRRLTYVRRDRYRAFCDLTAGGKGAYRLSIIIGSTDRERKRRAGITRNAQDNACSIVPLEPKATSLEERLRRLMELRDRGLIGDEEFRAQQRAILDDL